MTGSTRSGKSNLLNVIVLNTLRYIKDAEVYLIDFKAGVSFAPFIKLKKGGIKVVVADSVPAMGEAVLQYVAGKIINNISAEFKLEGVNDWISYYKRTNHVIPPRLVIIDEYRNLFTNKDSKAVECLEQLILQAANCNVHLILATQILNRGLPDDVLNQINGKIAFFNNDEEYRALFKEDIALTEQLNNDNVGQFVISQSNSDVPRLVQAALIENLSDEIDKINSDDIVLPSRSCDETTNITPIKIFIDSIDFNYYSYLNKLVFSNVVDSGKLIPLGNDLWIGDQYREFTLPMRRTISGILQPNDILLFGEKDNVAAAMFLNILYTVVADIITTCSTDRILIISGDMDISEYVEYLAEQYPDIVFNNEERDIDDINILNEYSHVFVYDKDAFFNLQYSTLYDLLNLGKDKSRATLVMYKRSFTSKLIETVQDNLYHSNDIDDCEHYTFRRFVHKFIFTVEENIVLKGLYKDFKFKQYDKGPCKYIDGSIGQIKDVWPYHQMSDVFIRKLIEKLNSIRDSSAKS